MKNISPNKYNLIKFKLKNTFSPFTFLTKNDKPLTHLFWYWFIQNFNRM